ncbi:hypothetical protein OGAPHI_002947 [Ogataea philodendri]|uniref:Aminopeptidase n=1 Tax=Ogataea philodendri TaxID=1378263 RepID=A0A9P8P7Q1_9ASCO|nr:uncharacterized protein OGAPHI_002947 [Ogataea philodendri]KAH3667298.1 hypothetical protein OGAPHI_002947 [Ogataea philodendri]
MSVPKRQVLPTNVKPVHYDVSLKPDLTTFKFDGEVAIDLKVQETSDFIELHALEIEFLEVQLKTSGGEYKPTKTTSSEKDQSTTFKFDESVLKEGETVQLAIKFIGELNDQLAGFYRSSYTENGETKYLATTQFEATDARRAFPSFDEPNLKATFSITLTAEKHYTFLSNMDVKEETLVSDTLKKVVFNKTPPMSTYLVAFIVGELNYVESEYKFRDVPIRVYTTPGYEADAKYSAELAAKALEYYEKVFDIPYPLPKMDMVGIHDFAAGAMENWGLVTYRMVDLMIGEKSSNAAKLRVSEVVAHELAHQWFGNICTMDFWDSLWLNESFATYMSFKCCDYLEKDWKIWENFVNDSFQTALSLDSLRSSHPIEVPVASADEINQIFDAISYEKGSSVLRMLDNWLGTENFIKGVSHYLNKHKYGNAVTEALWDSLAQVSGKDVNSAMQVWTKSVGYPLVQVSEKDGKVSVSQQRFLTTGDVKPEDDKTVFPIFLNLKTDSGIDNIVLDKKEATLDVKSSDFFKVNGNSTGVFRVNYEPERWTALGAASDKLSVEDKVGLLSDAGALSVAGIAKTTSLLTLVSEFKDEESYFVLSQLVSRLESLKAAWIFEDESVKAALESLVRDLISEKSHQKGWVFNSSDSFLDQSLKTLLFKAASSNKDEKTVEASKSIFAKYIAGDKSALDPNLRDSVFSVVASTGSQKEFDALLNIYKTSQISDEQITALRSLGKFSDEALLDKALSFVLDGTVRKQDIWIPMVGMSGSRIGIEKVFNFLTTNWDQIIKLVPTSLPLFGGVISIAIGRFTKKEHYDQIKAFFADKDTKAFDQKLAQGLESIEGKIKWLERDSENVAQWLKEHKYLK